MNICTSVVMDEYNLDDIHVKYWDKVWYASYSSSL